MGLKSDLLVSLVFDPPNNCSTALSYAMSMRTGSASQQPGLPSAFPEVELLKKDQDLGA